MDNMIYIKEYPEPQINYKEVCHYYGNAYPNDEERTLLDLCIGESEGSFTYKVCFRVFPVRIIRKDVDLGFIRLSSANLARNLSGCDRAVLFSATVGVEIDRLIARYSKISPAKALCFQAIGSERIEALCNAFCNDLKNEYGAVKPRFSPGYGDLSLECQKEIFRVLDCERKIGLTLTDSLLMMPSKSVSAFVGIRKGE